MTSSDRIEKQILLRAPRSRVWRALTDRSQFNAWFGVRLESDFVVGEQAEGAVTCAGFEDLRMALTVEAMQPERSFSFRWRPHAIDPKVDYSGEPTTLVEFTLTDKVDGTLLTVVESGFDRVPAHRRNEAFLRNSEGWAEQLKNVARHVAG